MTLANTNPNISNANLNNINDISNINLNKYKTLGLTLLQFMSILALSGLALTAIYKIICG